MRSVRIIVEGRVQGVGFRDFVLREAHARGVTGYVRNLRDGRVEAMVCGEPDAVAAICEACGRGPIGSRVTRVDVTVATDGEKHATFAVRRDN